MFAIFKRELKNYLLNPIGFIFIAIFFAMSGIMFFLNIVITGFANISGFFSSLFLTIIFSTPVLTMGVFSDEYKLNTDKLLFSCSIRDSSIVLGKYFAALVLYILAISINLVYVITILFFAKLQLSLIVGCFIGTIFLGFSLISIGVFVSSLTKSSVIAAFGTFGIFMSFTFMNDIAKYIPLKFLQKSLEAISIMPRYNNFIMGILNISDMFYFISLIFEFLILTVGILLKKRWS